MNRILFSFIFFLTFSVTAQTEMFTEKNVGSTGDFTSQPVSLQSELSHSQTIYYADDLEFKGEITEIRFKSAFYQSSRENVGNWIVRIGHTTKEEFAIGDPFVDVQTLTEVFNAGYDIKGYDVIVRFSTPFIYDGTQNLILDVQDVNTGYTTSLTAGFRGEENFNNPPRRSKMTFTHNGQTTGVYENSFANTRFIGNLERCPVSFSIDKDIIGKTDASFTINNPNNIAGFIYKIGLANEAEPTDFIKIDTDFSISNLTPGKDYILYYKSDCDVLPSSYKKLYFNTKPLVLTIPSTIDFETETNNYYIKETGYGFIKVSDEAGLNGSSKGLLLNGSSDFNTYNQWNNTGDSWSSNSDFISKINFTIDLTQNATNPVFKFNLQQTEYQSVIRLKIDGQLQEFEYDNSDVTYGTTRTISVDLSDFIGKEIELIIEHLGKSNLHKSYIDNIELKEATCLAPNNISFTATDNSITLNWDSDASNWEIASNIYDEPFKNTGTEINTKSFTFSNLEKAKAYTIYLRSKCDNSYSPWLKLYKATKPTLLKVPYSIDFKQTDIFSTTDFAINYNRYSKVYQDFYKQLYLDQKSTSKTYGWTGGINTTESQAWNDNKNFISSVSFLVDATNLRDLTAKIIFKQHYYYNSNTSWFRIKVNGNQIGESYNPNTLRFDPFTELNLDLTNYVGSIIELTLEQSGRNGPSNKNSITNAGDFTILRSVNFSSETLNIDTTTLEKSTLFPNPTTNKLHIKTEQKIHKVSIYDINSKLIFSKKTTENTLDVSRLKKGIYFLQISTENKSIINKKFIKL